MRYNLRSQSTDIAMDQSDSNDKQMELQSAWTIPAWWQTAYVSTYITITMFTLSCVIPSVRKHRYTKYALFAVELHWMFLLREYLNNAMFCVFLYSFCGEYICVNSVIYSVRRDNMCVCKYIFILPPTCLSHNLHLEPPELSLKYRQGNKLLC